MKKLLIFIASVVLCTQTTHAQLERKRIVTDRPEEVFLSMSLITMSTSSTLEKKNMNSTIMHNFGLVSTGVEEFWGMDQGAAVRLGFDYGITDRLTVGIGRTSREDNVDLRFKYHLLRQMKSGKIPVELTMKGDLGINTQKENRFDFPIKNRLNMFGSVILARKFSDALSVQISPMISHFNTVLIEIPNDDPKHTHFATGFGGEYRISIKHSFSFEYFGVMGARTGGTKNPMAVSWQIDTGGHVFQMFFMNGNWFTEQHLIARTRDDFFAGDFRLGFNVNRIFGL